MKYALDYFSAKANLRSKLSAACRSQKPLRVSAKANLRSKLSEAAAAKKPCAFQRRLTLHSKVKRSVSKLKDGGLRMTRPAVIANEVKQSMVPEFMDCRGLRPRNDETVVQGPCAAPLRNSRPAMTKPLRWQ
jgi:hypothetical protein